MTPGTPHASCCPSCPAYNTRARANCLGPDLSYRARPEHGTPTRRQPQGIKCFVDCEQLRSRNIRECASMRSRRSVAPRALAQARLARDPAARSRLWLIAARVSQAALAGTSHIWQVSEGPVGPVREHLFHDGVVAVLGFGLQEGEGCR